MSKPSDYENEIRKEWLIKVSHYNEAKANHYSYGLILTNRKGIRRCMKVVDFNNPDGYLEEPDYTRLFVGKPSQYILKYLQNRFKFRDLKIELVHCKDL